MVKRWVHKPSGSVYRELTQAEKDKIAPFDSEVRKEIYDKADKSSIQKQLDAVIKYLGL